VRDVNEVERTGCSCRCARWQRRFRAKARLTQAQLARRMATTQSVIARLESGRARPSTKTLERLATATGTRLRITFEGLTQL